MERKHYLDVAKGLGIFFVVWGHHPSSYLFKYLYTFHVPFFFFLSGLTYTAKTSDTLKPYIVNRAARLLKPYFIFAAILYVMWFIFDKTLGLENATTLNPIKQFAGIFYAQGGLGYMAWGTPLWFLPALFLTNVIYALIQVKISSKYLQAVTIFAIVALGFLSAITIGKPLPWSFDIALICLVFFKLGYLCSNIDLEKHNKLFILFAAAILLMINILTGMNHDRVVLYLYRFGNYFLFFASSITGVLGWFLVSYLINKSRVLEYIGQNSLNILSFHLRVFTFISLAIGLLGFNISLDPTLSTFMYSCVQIAVVLALGWLIQHFATKIKTYRIKRTAK